MCGASTPVHALDVPAIIEILAAPSSCSSDADRINRIRQLEELKSAVAAAQARETAAFVDSQRAEQRALKVPEERIGRGIAAQVALARRASHHQAQRYVGWAKILTTELPATFGALQRGAVSEWRTMLVARETAWLSRAHRARVDRDLAPRLGTLGDRRVADEARKAAYRLDPHGYVGHLRNVEGDRRVTLRPAPDTMSRLSALLPVAQGVAAYAALSAHADRAVAAGDTRTRGQLMADALVERLTGQARAQDVPLEVNLVMTDRSLLAEDDEPAKVLGYGTVPAVVARRLALDPASGGPVWLRRLYTDPEGHRLVAMDSRRRRFTPAQRRFVTIRDAGTCRTPWCDAPVRHIDHVRSREAGGLYCRKRLWSEAEPDVQR